MSKFNHLIILGGLLTALHGAYGNDSRNDQVHSGPGNSAQEKTAVTSPVADDVLFVVLGKMALYDQETTGALSLRNHHFVAEIMPKAGRKIISGTLTNSADKSQSIQFHPEGNAFLAHGARVSIPDELHQLHPDGEYVFSYQTQNGRMESQALELRKRATIDGMPAPARVFATQSGLTKTSSTIDAGTDLQLSWESMPGNTKAPASALADLVFVLAFDCFGNNVAHSGRPYQGGPYLTYADSEYVIPASALLPGLNYTVIVEQATADVESTLGVPGIATYATLTFLEIRTSGQPDGERCPTGQAGV